MDPIARPRRHPLAVATRLAALFALAAVGLAAAPAQPVRPLVPALDEGVFTISVGGQRLGSENFAFRVLRDSLCLASQSIMVQDDGAGHRDTVDKRVFMAVGKDDYQLHSYQSNQRYRGAETVRGIVSTPDDTLFSIYREYDGRGVGDRWLRPPGRMYVMDSRLFSLVDFICLTVNAQSFSSRPITMLTLGERDTLVEATLARVGRDTLRTGGRTTPVSRLRLTQGDLAFDLWVDSRGRLLRMVHAPSGLLVERQAVAVTPRRATVSPKRGG